MSSETIMFKRIDHIELIPADFERSFAFYTDILGFREKSRVRVGMPPLEEVSYMALGDTTLELMRVDDPAPAPKQPWRSGYRMMALEVDDMEAALSFLQEKGVAVTWGPQTMGTTKRAEIHDPDGNPIEIRQW